MSIKFERLPWDSNFFCYEVGRIFGQIFDESDYDLVSTLIKNNNSRLTYYSSSVPLSRDNFKFDSLVFKLVDIKLCFWKEISYNHFNKNLLSSTLLDDSYIDQLVEMSVQSGIYSRFNTDAFIEKNKFIDLYKTWMKESINKNMALEVLYQSFNKSLAGFITLGVKNNRGDIGLIAVDEAYRGKGIGKSLMFSAEHWFLSKGINEMQVVTQKLNANACRLYENCGFKILKTEYFYHIWNDSYFKKQ